MSLSKATAHLEKYGLADRIIITEQSSATVELAAIALGCKPEEIAKSMTFFGHDGTIIMILAAGDVKIDNRKFKDEFGLKAKMLPFDETEQLIGHGAGGICPFGVNGRVKVYLDESLKRFSVVYPAAGTPNSGVRLTVAELEKASEAEKWVDVCKLREEAAQ